MHTRERQEIGVGVAPLTIIPSDLLGGSCISCCHNFRFCGSKGPHSQKEDTSTRDTESIH